MTVRNTVTLKALTGMFNSSAEAHKKSRHDLHLTALAAVTFIVTTPKDDERKAACEGTAKWLNEIGIKDRTTRNLIGWMTMHFRIGVDHDSKTVTAVRFKANSEKADDFAAAEANPFWVSTAKPSEEAAEKIGVEEVAKIIAATAKRLDAIINGNATAGAKTRARKARKALIDC